jgi:hypothetical protein
MYTQITTQTHACTLRSRHRHMHLHSDHDTDTCIYTQITTQTHACTLRSRTARAHSASKASLKIRHRSAYLHIHAHIHTQITHCTCSFGFKGVIEDQTSICESLYKFLPDTLIHYWPLDGNVRDYTDNRAHFTIKGDVILRTTGGPYQNLRALDKQFGNSGYVLFGDPLLENYTRVNPSEKKGRAMESLGEKKDRTLADPSEKGRRLLAARVAADAGSQFPPPKYLERENFKAPMSKSGDFTVCVCEFFCMYACMYVRGFQFEAKSYATYGRCFPTHTYLYTYIHID